MSSSASKPLLLTTAPFLSEGGSTNRMMWEVVAALVPVLIAATWFFGLAALLVTTACVLGACLTEWLAAEGRKIGTLRDGSALLTGLLLAFTLPPGLPLWMAFLGGVAAVALGKLIWGGLGRNMFNPALVGRAFLQAAFPIATTTWTAPGGDFFELPASTLAAPLMQPATDVVSSATPLGLAKFEGVTSELSGLLWGNVGGSLGETSGLLLIACAIFLVLRKTFDWRLLVSTVVGVAVFAGIMHLINPDAYPGPLFMVFSGGLLFGAVFMVTDPVTSPLTKKGAWIFGIGIAFLVVLIRLFGGLPEAVMYAILLMNAAVPHINRYTQPRRFGG